MKVLALQADLAGCGWYRIVAPARAMVAAGRDLSISESLTTRSAQLPDGSFWVEEVREPVDRIVFQRPVTQHMYAAAVQAKEQGLGVTVELDDNFDLVRGDHAAYSRFRASGRGFGGPWENPEWLRRTIEVADRLVVSTPALAKHYGRRAGLVTTVMLNALPTLALEIGQELDKNLRLPLGHRTFGWSGHAGSHVGDLVQPNGAVGDAAKSAGWGLWCVGDPEGTKALLGKTSGVPYGTGDWETEIAGYYRSLAAITVGVVPLADTDFNRSKSDVKGQEFALLTQSGRAVASRVGEYERLWGSGAVTTTKNRYAGWTRALRAATGAHVTEGPREVSERARTARVLDPGAWWSAWTGE